MEQNIEKEYVTTIYIRDGRDVKNISNILNKFPDDIDVRKGRYMIDGKSVIGLLMFSGSFVDVYLPNYKKSTADSLIEELAEWRVNDENRNY